ncbi:TetR/AcrR family transcriptional regulator [Salinispora arenicola]|uniref:TetR/AcrR family transcriptional regulator n=1 Tax=Salinispora arenicola TaxID=168697 RepID=UPI00037BB06F|nr:TetR/AcrR family transcriptional regulator [Salinispora arenicola]NIL44116.1 TetR/AcrR family transcriptional regulator [Salinispora arenicola]
MTTTADRILDSAQALAQVRGYNGFSYADISAELSITKPSIHHHFPTKAALAEALIARYREQFAAARQQVDSDAMGARERLLGYAGLYAKVFADGGRLCLCGVFAADAESLPAPARQATAEFFADQQRWVAGVLAEAGLPASRTGAAAQAYLAALEGALLLARAHGQPGSAAGLDRDVVRSVAATLLDALV